jgi:hypothetical protein
MYATTQHLPAAASASAPVVETPEQAHERRLAASIERWRKTADYCRARGMRSELKRAERTLARLERARELSGILSGLLFS